MIKSHEEANTYYNKINGLVDQYLEQNKIRPSNLKRYLQPGTERFTNFLKRNNLEEEGCERILSDILEDRYAMEADQILKFESFNVFESQEFKIQTIESCLYANVLKPTIEHEKILADVFDTSLGHINVLDGPKHLYQVETLKDDDRLNVIIWTSPDIDVIKSNLQDFAWETLNKSSINIYHEVKLPLNKLVSKENFESIIESIINKEITVDILKRFMSEKGIDLKVSDDRKIIFVK